MKLILEKLNEVKVDNSEKVKKMNHLLMRLNHSLSIKNERR